MLMPDGNVLVDAHRADTQEHLEHAEWISRLADPKIFARPSTLDEALAFDDELRRRSTCHLLRPGARHWDIFVALCRRASATGGLVSDAYHAAVAIEHACEWVTNDLNFARFTGLRWRPPHQA